MSHDVFLSHSSKDKNVANAVCATLEKEGIRCWIAPRDIRAGDSWGSSIIKGIEESRVMVIIFSENANASQQVMREVERAVQKNVVVVPFRIDSVQPSADMEYFLSATHWLDAMTPEMDQHLEKLVATINSILERPDSRKAEPPQPVSETPKTEPLKPVETKKKNPALILGAVAALAILLIGFMLLKPSGSDEFSAGNEQSLNDGNIRISLAKQSIGAEPVEVKISGKPGDRDYIAIGKSDSQDSSYLQKANVNGSKVVSLNAPDQEGLYEVRYFNGQNRTVVARRALKVKSPEVKLDAVRKSMAGTQIDVTWKAPNNKGDYLTIAEKDSPGTKYLFYSYTRDGSPTSIRVPVVEGDYEIRYISGQKKTIWARRDFEALAPKGSVSAPKKAVAGSNIVVNWKGAGLKGDYLSIAEPSSEGRKYVSYKYLQEGGKQELRLPDDPGSYEVRYVSGGSNIVRDSTPIRVTAVEVEISKIGEVVAGSEFTVKVEGPRYRNDYVAIFTSDDTARRYLSYKYASHGESLKFTAPKEPGSYVMKYISGQAKREWGSRPFEVKAE